MKRLILAATLAASAVLGNSPAAAAGKVEVVATISTYGYLAEVVGGDRVHVVSLVRADQDPHFVQPKLSLVEKLARADLFIDTGLDLELWVPALQDSAGNKKIMSGAAGYVSASKGVRLLDKVAFADRKEGDVHIYGNPHIYLSPIAHKRIAANIAIGLERVDPSGATVYRRNLRAFTRRVDRALFGDELVRLLGASKLSKLAEQGRLIDFLSANSYKGKKLIDYLGGWMKQALPLRGQKVVAYHKNWTYFAALFGFEVVEYMEPKPGIPPSPRHIRTVVNTIAREKIRVLIAATYYDGSKINAVAKRTGLDPVVVGISVGSRGGGGDVFAVTDNILSRMLAAL
jgi:zinc/manganese transport system substrate-binding protein